MPAQPSARLSHELSTSTTSHQDELLAAYEGYWDLRGRGEAVNLEEYCARFPELRSSLPNLLRAGAFFDEHQSRLAPATPDEPSEAWPEAGDVFLDFELHRELGRGGFSRVFLATQPALGHRWVAVKLYKKPMREARILGPLNHPNVVPINSLQIDPARRMAAICMPYSGSSTLLHLLDLIGKDGVPAHARTILHAAEDTAAPQQLKDQSAIIPADNVLQHTSYVEGICHLGAQLADALAFIHKRGICHRDLKPSNVLLKPGGQPMLLDFNLSEEAEHPTARMGGTLPYMSPEQLQAWWRCYQEAQQERALSADQAMSADRTVQTGQPRPEVTAAADLYSLGVMLYELLSGVHPFGPIPPKISVEDLHRLIDNRQQLGFKPLRQVCPKVDPRVAAVIDSCLALQVSARPKSADIVARRLCEPLANTERKRVRRNRWLVAAACVFFATAGAAGAFIGHLLRSDPAAQLQTAIDCAHRGEHERAIDQTTQLLTDDPDNFEARFLRGRLYQRLGQWNQRELMNAMSDFSFLQRLKPEGRVSAALGYCRQSVNQLRHTGGAIACYLQAIEQNYDNGVVRNNLGRGYALDGQPEAAKQHFDTAVRLDPRLQPALLNRAANALNLYFKSKNEQHLRDGIHDVAAGLKLGESADLYAVGAMLHSVAARKHPEEIPAALSCYSNAVRLGKSLNPADSCFRAVKDMPEFQKLATQKTARSYQPLPLILDPVQPGDAPI